MERLDPGKLPHHIAIIMDGNGRWAQHKHLSRIEGHRKGIEVVEEVIKACDDLGIKILTLYAFSKENWRRPSREVNGLMRLLQSYLEDKGKKLLEEKNLRLIAIGDLEDLPPPILDTLNETMEKTRHKDGLIVNVALSYGGRSEIISGVKKLIQDIEEGTIHKDDINPEMFSRYLFTKELPDPDLLIRTSGELRISNFLLWQIAYTELYFTTTLWPDFNRGELTRALSEYQTRERRFGLTASQIREGFSRR